MPLVKNKATNIENNRNFIDLGDISAKKTKIFIRKVGFCDSQVILGLLFGNVGIGTVGGYFQIDR